MLDKFLRSRVEFLVKMRETGERRRKKNPKPLRIANNPVVRALPWDVGDPFKSLLKVSVSSVA